MMDERAGAGAEGRDWALAAELLVVGLLLGWGSFSGFRLIVLLLLASMSLWMRGRSWAELGLRRPSAPGRAVAAGVLWALVVLLAVRFAIEPFAVWLTGTSVDLSALQSIRGNPGVLAMWMIQAWTLAAFGEEMVFRGYLMRRLADLVGHTRAGWAAALVAGSACFGLAHRYQGPAGMVTTGMMGVLIALLYLRSGRNLWPVIVCHAAVDAVALTAVYLDRASLLFP